MAKQSAYVARQPDAHGIVRYTDEENAVWKALYERQVAVIEGRVCNQFLEGLEALDLPADRIPQLPEVSARLREATGWEVVAVPALINFDEFFRLLANRQFPAATFIRSRDEFDYLQEPDIFHEIFGHCPMLMHPAFAAFTHAYGRYGLAANKRDRVMLARLYWFTVEFGLLRTEDGLRIYGGGISSSPGETRYALESDTPDRRDFDPVAALRTPYRIDIYQTVYYVLDHLETLFELARSDLAELIRTARELGEFAPTFPPREKRSA